MARVPGISVGGRLPAPWVGKRTRVQFDPLGIGIVNPVMGEGDPSVSVVVPVDDVIWMRSGVQYRPRLTISTAFPYTLGGPL